MGTFFEIIAVLSPIWITAFIVFVVWRCDKRQYNKIKFKDFKKFYELNPKRWRCETSYVFCSIKGDFDEYEVFMFKFIDECKYRLWRRRCNKVSANKERAAATQRMLDAVKEDIANAKAQETTDLMAAFKQLFKEIKDQKMTDELPSLAELLKKYGVE
jgi:hypothetical protein